MNTKGILLGCLFLLTTATNTVATEKTSEEIADSLYSNLSEASTPTDSLRIMENLFDVLPRGEGSLLGLEIFDVANRAGDSSAALNILR
ncbi:MAG: hypothetical protein K2F88_08495, partial [Duncaniella sp.]|nr:hypothetical protein [Duncaniella sp.]